jgi:hypothetical protein
MNPTVPQRLIDKEMARDPASAAAEYLAEFRSDIESFITPEAVRACIADGIRERQPDYKHRYISFTDAAGGSGGDSFTLAIAHLEDQQPQCTAILDLAREVAPSFSPEGVVKEFCEILRRYRITKTYGDRFAGEWRGSRQNTLGALLGPAGLNQFARCQPARPRQVVTATNCA